MVVEPGHSFLKGIFWLNGKNRFITMLTKNTRINEAPYNYEEFLAKTRFELIKIFCREFVGGQKPVGDRHFPEGHEWFYGRFTYAASGRHFCSWVDSVRDEVGGF
jgi:hypothetical protein